MLKHKFRIEQNAMFKRYGNVPSVIDRIENLKKVVDAIDSIEFSNGEEYDRLYEDVVNIMNGGAITPLFLDKDEFYNGINTRNSSIVSVGDEVYANLDAYKLQVKRSFDGDSCIETDFAINNILNFSNTIEITAGGVSVNKYFNYAYIKEEDVNKHCYIPHKPIIIPVNLIYFPKTGRSQVFLMDKREPAFYELKKYYDITIVEDKERPKYDIRKYKKIH